MPLYVKSGEGGWIPAAEGRGASGPVEGFDTDSGRPVWRHPVSGHWVDGTGNVISPLGTGYAQFHSSSNGGLVPVLL